MKTRKLLYLVRGMLLLLIFHSMAQANAAGVDSVVFPGLSSAGSKTVAAKEKIKNPLWRQQHAPKVTLEKPVDLLAKSTLETKSTKEKVGFSRQIAALKTKQKTKDVFSWQKEVSGGHTATLILSSPGALALRIAIGIEQLPESAEIRFFQPVTSGKNADVERVTGAHILGLIAMNLQQDPENIASRQYWSPTMEGEAIGLEIFLPAGISPDDVEISFPQLSHLFASPFNSLYSDEEEPPGSYCDEDVNCFPAWSMPKRATAKMVFTDGGDTYLCTGVLLNDRAGTHTPYFITANHCIGEQGGASSLETLWFYESPGCNLKGISPHYSRRSGGAELLWTMGKGAEDASENQDFSLLQLNDTPPGGAVFAGWDQERTLDIQLTGVHHPSGALKRISFGYLNETDDCFDISGTDGFDCIESSGGNFLDVIWTHGGAEHGSSGSGVFTADGRVIGVLSGGWSPYCKGGRTYYSEFQSAYYEGDLGQWLNYRAPVTVGVTIQSLEIAGPTELSENNSASFTCTVHYSDETSKEVTNLATWSDNSPYGTVSNGGYFYASPVTNNTRVQVMASYGGVTASHEVEITNLVAVTPFLHLLF